MTCSRLLLLASLLCLGVLGSTQLFNSGRVAAQFSFQHPAQQEPALRQRRPPIPPATTHQPEAEQIAPGPAEATENPNAARTAAPNDTQQLRELSIDDGRGESIYVQDNLMMVNRLTPAAYPANLESVSIVFAKSASQPDPTGQPITLLIYADPSGSGQLPANPQFTRVPARVTAVNGSFTVVNISDGPTINSGDFYVGYQTGAPANGAGFLVDTNSTKQDRTFFSTNNGASFQILQPPTGAASANALIRANAASFTPASLTIAALTPNNAPAFIKRFVLTLTGTNFARDSEVRWNGYLLTTTFISETQLQLVLGPHELAVPGTASVRVEIPFKAISNTMNFTINPGTLAEAENEPNDSYATADALPIPGRRTGVVAANDPGLDRAGEILHDLYAFNLTKATNVDLLLQWSDAATDMDIWVISDFGPFRFAEYPTNQAGVAITAERLYLQLPAGRYILAVRGWEGAATPYTLSATIPTVVLTNAASFGTEEAAAPDAIVAAFGSQLATATEAAATLPLPNTLAGTTVKVKDSTGVERLAPLFYVSPTQINFLVPPDTAPGLAEVTTTSSNGSATTSRVIVRKAAPGLFTLNGSIAAGYLVRVKSDGTQSYETFSRFNTTTNRFELTPIDLGPEGETVVLVLYGTGVRGRRALQEVEFEFSISSTNRVKVPTLYAGPVTGFAGLDQVNVVIPRTLQGRGNISGRLSMQKTAAYYANSVSLNIK